MGEYKYFCSLGSLCHVARMMQRIHVKNVSYPFDWCFTDENIVIDCLNDNFNKFLDQKYYQDVVHKFHERTCGHSLYHEDLFFHKNPRNKDDYEYYKRCVDRFNQMLKSWEKKLFIFMYSPLSTRHPSDVYQIFENNIMSKEEIIENLKQRGQRLNDTLSKYTNNYRLALIMNFGQNNDQSFSFNSENTIDYILLNTKSNSSGVTFFDNSDNLYFSGLMCEHYIK